MIRVLLIFSLIFLIKSVLADNKYITIASTTSTHDTGLLEYINKEFKINIIQKLELYLLEQGRQLKLQWMEM